MLYIDKQGWPIIMHKGRHLYNFIRILLHADSLMSRARWKEIERDRYRNRPMRVESGPGTDPLA